MKIVYVLKKVNFLLVLVLLIFSLTSAKRSAQARKQRFLPLTSVHMVDRNGFSETISNKDRLSQLQTVDFLQPQTYQKILRIYARDSKSNVRSVVTTYHPNGNPKQFLEILNGRASGIYREWHPNGILSVSTKIIGGAADITPAAEKTWLFDGVSNAWDEEGHLIAEILYSKGNLEGVSTYYHASGHVWRQIPYLKNAIHGTAEIYKENGELLQQTQYAGGVKEGCSLRYWDQKQVACQEEYRQGKLENGQYFDKKNNLIAEIAQGTGNRALFNKEAVQELQEYRQGVLEGEVKVFNAQGKIKRLYHVKDGVKHGEEVDYYETALDSSLPLQAKLSFNWHEGRIQGHVKTWYINGNLESQRELSNNMKNGVATAWYRDGNLMLIEEYEHDNLQRGDYFKKGEKTPSSQVIQGKGTVSLFDANGHFLQKIPYLNGKPDA